MDRKNTHSMNKQQYIDMVQEMQSGKINAQRIHDIDNKIRNLERRPETWILVRELLEDPLLYESGRIIIYASKLLKTKLKYYFHEISEEDAKKLFKFIIAVLINSQLNTRIYSIKSVFMECLVIIYAHTWKYNPNILDYLENVMEIDYFVEFSGLIAKFFTDISVVMEETKKKEFSDFCYQQLLPKIINVINDRFIPPGTDVKEVKVAIVFFETLEYWITFLWDENKSLPQLDSIFMSNKCFVYGINNLKDILLSEAIYSMLLEFLVLLKKTKVECPLFWKEINKLIKELFELVSSKKKKTNSEDLMMVIKLLSYVFRNFLDKVDNSEHLIVTLATFINEDIDCKTNLLYSFKQFIKKMIQKPNRNEWVPFVNVLWKKLLLILQLDSSTMSMLDDSLYSKYGVDEYIDIDDDSLKNRKSAKHVIKYLSFFLDQADILDVIKAELDNIFETKNEIYFETLLYFFNSLTLLYEKLYKEEDKFKIYKNDLKDVITEQITRKKIIYIYGQIVNLMPHFKRYRIFVSFNKLTKNLFLGKFIELINENPVQVKFYNEWFLHMVKKSHETSALFNKVWQSTFKEYIWSMNEIVMDQSITIVENIIKETDYNEKILKLFLNKLASMKKTTIIDNYFDLFFDKVRGDLEKKDYNSLNDNLEILLTILKYIHENKVYAVTPDLLYLFATLLEIQPLNYDLIENLSTLNKTLLKRLSITQTTELILQHYENLVARWIDNFRNTLLPTYMYYFEQIIDVLYDDKHYEYFFIRVEQFIEIFIQAFDDEGFNGKCYILSNGSKQTIEERFQKLFRHCNIEIDDIFDDFFGLYKKLIKRNYYFVINSKHTLNVLTLLAKIYSPLYIHSVLTIVPLLRTLTNIRQILYNENFDVFWCSVFYTGFRILIEEAISSSTSIRIIKVNLSIIDAFYPVSVNTWLTDIMNGLSVSILTPTEKQVFIDRIIYIKNNNDILSYNDEKIKNICKLINMRAKNSRILEDESDTED